MKNWLLSRNINLWIFTELSWRKGNLPKSFIWFGRGLTIASTQMIQEKTYIIFKDKNKIFKLNKDLETVITY